jgi:hypothetical protein
VHPDRHRLAQRAGQLAAHEEHLVGVGQSPGLDERRVPVPVGEERQMRVAKGLDQPGQLFTVAEPLVERARVPQRHTPGDEHVGERRGIVSGAGDREGLVGERAPGGQGVLEDHLGREVGEEPRAVGGRARVRPLDRAAEHCDPLVVDGAVVAPVAAVVGERRGDEQSIVAQLLRSLGRQEQRLPERGLARELLGGAEAEEHPGERAGVAAAHLDEVTRLLEPRDGLFRRELLERVLPGAA